jgi:formylglycine-generating enzyme required for sulfatase activity
MLLVDACRDVPADPTPDSRNARGIEGRRIDLPEGTGVYFSCSAGQMSFEKPELGHGLFTYCVLEGLRGQAASATGEISWSRLVAHVDDRMTHPDLVRLMPTQLKQVPIPSGALPQTVLGKVRPARSAPMPTPAPAPAPTVQPKVLAKDLLGRRAGETRGFGGDLKLLLCWCPPGQFRMGSPPTEAGRSQSESEDQVDVTLSHGFWLGQTEVTQGEWEAVMGTQPWFERGNADHYREGEYFPVVYVDGHDALAFCQRLTELEQSAGRLPEGWTYSLPTEAQWEYACRAGRTGPYNGDGSGVLGDYAWYQHNTDRIDFANSDEFLEYNAEPYAHVVAQKRPNRWGLYDMHGNVCEWCLDVFAEKLPGGVDPLSRTGTTRRVLRGGGHDSSAIKCRSASRASILEAPVDAPGLRVIGWDDGIGFRLYLGPTPKP